MLLPKLLMYFIKIMQEIEFFQQLNINAVRYLHKNVCCHGHGQLTSLQEKRKKQFFLYYSKSRQ